MNNDSAELLDLDRDKTVEAQKAYLKSDKGKLTLKRYRASPKGRKSQEIYEDSEKGQLAKLRYYNSEKAKQTRQKQKDRRDLMQAYAKFLERNPGTTIIEFMETQKGEA